MKPTFVTLTYIKGSTVVVNLSLVHQMWPNKDDSTTLIYGSEEDAYIIVTEPVDKILSLL